MTREALADRIVSYCDALAAFSLVNALAFLITLADPDIRCSIAGIAAIVIGAIVMMSVLITGGLVALRRFERSLRPPDSQDPAIERFWRNTQVLRLVVVWVVALLVTFGSWAATQDPACRGAASPFSG